MLKSTASVFVYLFAFFVRLLLKPSRSVFVQFIRYTVFLTESLSVSADKILITYDTLDISVCLLSNRLITCRSHFSPTAVNIRFSNTQFSIRRNTDDTYFAVLSTIEWPVQCSVQFGSFDLPVAS